MSSIQNAGAQQKHRTILGIAAVAALGGLLFGYDTGVIAGSQLYFTQYFQLSLGEQGWAVSSALYGCLLGALASGYLAKAISRKFTLIIAAFLFSLSAWGSGIANPRFDCGGWGYQSYRLYRPE
ncbi:MFS transporter [Porticoccaceae bacterium]|nr:MFS transporter [Porticoccaceae bacterium]